MRDAIQQLVLVINHCGELFWGFASTMFVQVVILTAALACLDWLLRHRVRAVVRYWIWLLVLAKLLLPTGVGTPASLAYWLPASATAPSDVGLGEAPPVAADLALTTPEFTSPPTIAAADDSPQVNPALPSRAENEAGTPVLSQPNVPRSVGAPAAERRSIKWKGMAVIAWALAVAGLLAVLWQRGRKIRALVNQAAAAPAAIQSVLAECLPALSLDSRQVRLRISERLASPAICGFLRPTILLPRRGLERLGHDQLRLILLHELVHWKRGDLQVNCLQTVLQILYFYNPAVWLAGAIIRRLREQAVDETVLVLRRDDAQRYAATLVDLAAVSLQPGEAMLRLIGVVESRTALAGRIKRIVGRPIPRSAKLGLTGLAAIFAIALLLLPMARGDRPGAVVQAAPATETEKPTRVDDKPADDQPKQDAKPAAAASYALSGHLVSDTGEPVTDAQIEMFFSAGGSIITAHTDEEGRYHFGKVSPPGEYSLRVLSKRWIGFDSRDDRSHVDLPAGEPVVRDFTLQPACRLQLEVVDDQGQPIGGVSVYSQLPSDSNMSFSDGGSTNRNGTLLVGGLKPSRRERRLVALTDENHVFGRLDLVLDDPSVIVERKVVLQAGHAIEGKAICNDGKPAAGWTLIAMPVWWQMGIQPAGSTVGADGSFTLPHVGDEKYNVIVSIPTGEGSSTPRTILTDTALPESAKPLALKIDFPSPAGMAKITGHIEYDGPPATKGIHVTAHGVRNFFGSAFVRPGEKSFEIGPVPTGTYSIDFNSTEIEAVDALKVVVPSKPLDVKIVVRGQMKLAGTVVEAATGDPLRKFSIQVTKQRSLRGPNFEQEVRWHEVENDQGRFSVDIVGPGIYTVNATADGFAPASLGEISTENESAKGVRIALSSGATLTGKIIDDQGRPIDGARVTPFLAASGPPSDDPRSASNERTVMTKGGAFTIAHFAFDKEGLEITHSDHAVAILPVIATPAKNDGEPLKITLHRGTTVRGHVYDEEGKPVANTPLHFRRRSYTDQGGSDRRAADLATPITDANGFYEVHDIPSDDCHVNRADVWNTWGVVRQMIRTEDRKTQTLDFGGLAETTGRLVVNGRAVANTKLIVSGESAFAGPLMARAQTDEQGNFVFRGIPVGRRTLYFDAPQATNHPFPLVVKSFDAAIGGIDLGTLELTAAHVTVRVEGAPGEIATDANVFLAAPSPSAFGVTVGGLRSRSDSTDPAVWVYEYIPAGKYEVICRRRGQFDIHQALEVTAAPEQVVDLKLPVGAGSLSGRCDPSISGGHNLNVWSKDQRLWSSIMPNEDGTYRLENTPAGEYTIRRYDARDADVLLTFSLAAGQRKTLDITPQNISKLSTQPSGIRWVYAYTAEGVYLPGCQIEFPDAKSPPALLRRTDYGSIFTGDAEAEYAMTVSYPGFKSVSVPLVLRPTGMGPPPPDLFLRVFLVSVPPTTGSGGDGLGGIGKLPDIGQELVEIGGGRLADLR